MNDATSASALAEQPLSQVLACLEESFFHSKPARELRFFLDMRESLRLREIADHEREDLVRIVIVIARSCFAGAVPREGLATIQGIEAMVATLPDSDMKRQFYTVKGGLCLDLGEFACAFEANATSLEIARRMGNRQSEARAFVNLAALFVDFGRPWDTLKLGERVLAMHREEALDPITVAAVLNNMSEACLITHQAERGIDLGNQVLLVCPVAEAPQRAQLCTAHITLARLHLLRGRLSAAERELAAARDSDAGIGFSRTKLRLQITAALIDHEKGRLRQAVQSLKEALVLAGTDTSLAKEALSALVTIYEKEGHPNSALKYLQRLTALTEPVNLDQVRERLASLGLGERSASDAGPLDAESFNNDFRLRTASLRKSLTDSQVEVLERLAVAAEMRDDVTGMHCYRVGKWAQLIALEMGLPAMEADSIEIAARLHDIGKIGVPDHILMKPGKLDAVETEVIRRHAVMGARLLSRSKTPQIRVAEKVAMTHHERWDGKGYPQGLVGEAIPMAGRITAVADVFDALAHERPYKLAWTEDDALRMIQSLSGSAFDPAVVSAFLSVAERLCVDGGSLDQAIESRLKRTRIMRIRDFVMSEREQGEGESQRELAAAG